ncbi:follistatin-like [Rhopilema esculentum]|uniref:follistatin-like n=1 Tax=Rhopilema esculentum TaxID=499914 RepID=UPI0031CF7A5C
MENLVSMLAILCAVLHAVNSNCLDRMSNARCKKYAKYRACKYRPVKMAVFCPKTCGYCKDRPVCTDIKCPPSKICVMDENGNPGCRCLVECKKKFGTGPVCGHNGVEYPDLCDLINAECKTGDYILVRKYGSCVRKVTCKDREREAKLGLCKSWQKMNACFDHPVLMRTYCPKTCGFCRQPNEPKCERSKYGCCWSAPGDKSATGPYGQGCGECKDAPFCKYFKQGCGSERASNIKVMKKMCPFTCHYCQPARLIGG